MRFGVSYYHEYHRHERLALDIEMMRDASMNVVRAGESTWASYEPEDGVFTFDAFDRVVDALGGAGIDVIVGTPTYAIPPWLARAHPEVMAHRSTDRPIPYGHRQNVDFTSPVFRRYAERVIRQMVGRYAAHPAVIGFQVDNETGIEILHNPKVFEGFKSWLLGTIGDVERLNDVWGLTYWSHRLNDIDDLWVPDGNTNPGYDLAWRRYQAELTTGFLAWQADIVREIAGSDRFVTQCLIGAHGRPTADGSSIGQVLDAVSVNVYYATQAAFELPVPAVAQRAKDVWMSEIGAAWIYMTADAAYGLRNSPFLVSETNATSVGGPAVNYPHYPGQRRMAALALVARGASMIAYWHWHSLHYGFETYWGGVLGHDYRPGRTYRELSAIGDELDRHAPVLDGLRPDADVAFLYSIESRWALSRMSPFPVEGGITGDRRSWERIFEAFYLGFFDAGFQASVFYPDQDIPDVPVVVVPGCYVATDALLEKLRAYAEAGGHLVLTLRTGVADEFARVRTDIQPAHFADVSGMSYVEFSNLTDPLPVQEARSGLSLSAGAAATKWMDVLEPESCEVLATYDSAHWGDVPAVTSKALGEGRVTWVGTVPNAVLSRDIASWCRRMAGLADEWGELPATARATSATLSDGRRAWFVFNHSDEPVTLQPPAEFETIDRTPDADLELSAWDAAILVGPRGNEAEHAEPLEAT